MSGQRAEQQPRAGAAAAPRQQSFFAVATGAAIGGLTETAGFYWMDVCKTRYTDSKSPYKPMNAFPSTKEYLDYYRKIFFKDAWNKSVPEKIASSYAGVEAGFIHKIPQRVLLTTLGVYVLPKLKDWIKDHAPETWSPISIGLLAGVLGGGAIGIFEAMALSPLDRLKILMMLNPEGQKKFIDLERALALARQERVQLWKGWQLAAVRNFLGAGSQWSVELLLREHLLEGNPEVDGKKTLTPWQHLLISCCSITASIIASNPVNVAKIRMQNSKDIDATVWKEFIKVLTHGEALRGTAVNLALSGTKKIVSLTVTKIIAEQLMSLFQGPQRVQAAEIIPGVDAFKAINPLYGNYRNTLFGNSGRVIDSMANTPYKSNRIMETDSMDIDSVGPDQESERFVM